MYEQIWKYLPIKAFLWFKNSTITMTRTIAGTRTSTITMTRTIAGTRTFVIKMCAFRRFL